MAVDRVLGPKAPPHGSTRARIPEEEIRFALVLNGGVSLAVWMGGATLEINRITNADGPYRYLLELIRSSARADVISGTSAGGINGAALALAQVNEVADLSVLRDVWADQGRMESLLRRPFRGGAPSLLQGDEFFLPQLRDAFRRLISPYRPVPEHARPIDLTITTTLLRGALRTTVDGLGQTLYQTIHEGRFRFCRDADAAMPLGAQPSTDFAPDNIRRTVRRLALAARCTAGFPVAFEPSFVPATRSGTGGDDDLRPDMGAVASWMAEGDAEDGSRFTVDGGVLVNTPTQAALESIDRMPAEGPVRRIMLLLHPHALEEVVDRPDTQDEMPPLTRSTVGLLAAMSSQAGRSFAEQIDARNRAAGGRRATRAEALASLAEGAPQRTAQRLQDAADQLLPYYGALRIRRAARDLARRVPPVEQWHHERIRRAAEAAQAAWMGSGRPRVPGEGVVPYVPPKRPPAGLRALSDGVAWPWGLTTVEHLLNSALDLLKRLVWVLPMDARCETVKRRRMELHELRATVRQLREAVDGPWLEEPVLAARVPDQDYWTLRLIAYRYAMFSDAPPLDAAESLTDEQRDRLDRRLGRPGAIGRLVCGAVLDVAGIVAGVVPHLSPTDRALDGRHLDLAELRPWQALLTAAPTRDEVAADLDEDERVLGRLLNLCIVTTCLGQDIESESEQTVELAQISLQAQSPFARHSRAADDKAAGMALSRFSGFLKQSWRINDWIWGRMDAATILCRVLLDPYRLRRIAVLDGTMGTDPRAHALTTVRALVRALLGAGLEQDLHGDRGTADARLREAHQLAIEELTSVYDPNVPVGNLPRILPGLAALAAWGVHWRIALEELPVLAAAIRADQVEGASRMSRGETFLATQAALLERLARVPAEPPSVGVASPPSDERVRTGLDALTAFDRAGIGREGLTEERTSDQMIRTAATAAGVALTVMDGPQSGLSAVRPVTRALRGAALLPYWVVVGLTRGGSLAKFLALLALAMGGMLTALAVLAPLPDWAAGPAAAVGAASLLTAFGYGALRTGTLLHGVVLLTPVIPLLVFAWGRLGGNLTRGVTVLVAVGLLAAGLVALGSLPAPMLDPLTVLRRVWPSLLRQLAALVLLAAAGAAAFVAGGWMVSGLLAVRWQATSTRLVVVGAALAIVAASGAMAWVRGRRLRLWRRAVTGGHGPDAAGETWEADPMIHTGRSTAQWSVVYGTVYLAVATWLLLAGRWSVAHPWVQVAIVVFGGFATALLLVVPWVAPGRACKRLAADIVEDATPATYPSTTPAAVAATLLERLQAHNRTYAFLVHPVDGVLALTLTGRLLSRSIGLRLTRLARLQRPRGRPAGRRAGPVAAWRPWGRRVATAPEQAYPATEPQDDRARHAGV